MKVKTDQAFSSGRSNYLTDGKEYKVYQYKGYEITKDYFSAIIDDNGVEHAIVIDGCAHLFGKAWIIVEDEFNDSYELKTQYECRLEKLESHIEKLVHELEYLISSVKFMQLKLDSSDTVND
jgi:hypothetical protein